MMAKVRRMKKAAWLFWKNGLYYVYGWWGEKYEYRFED
jgi:hypothetical protein